MSDNNTTQWTLDLDAEGTKKTLDEINDKLGAIHDESHKTAIATVFTAIAEGSEMALEVVHKLGEAAEWVFDKVLDAEKVATINFQFEQLSKNAGVSSEKLLEGFENASKGMTPTVDILRVANQALINLGGGQEKLPQLFAVAQKSAVAFGGTAVEKFELLARAIEFGNQRMLRQAGIFVDVDKATKSYAASIGVAVDQLTPMLKQQAMLNAVLEYGDKKMVDAPKALRQVSTAWLQLKTTVSETVESLGGVLNKWFGGILTTAMSHLTEEIHVAKKALDWLRGAKEEIAKDDSKSGPKPASAEANQSVQLEQEISKARLETHKKELEQKQAQDKKYMSEKIALEQKGLQVDKIDATTEAELVERANHEKLLANQQYEAKRAELKTADVGGEKRRAELIKQLEHNHTAELKQIDSQLERDRDQMRQQRELKEGSALKRMAAGAKNASQQAQDELKEFDKTGAKVWGSFTNRASQAFQAMGEGSQNAGDAMKGFMFGALGDIAQAQGELLLASALVNPLNAAAGAALLVLAGVLHSMGSSSTSTSGLGGGSISGGGEVAPALPNYTTNAPGDTLTQEAATKKSVTIQIMGHYFDTDETKQRLAQLIRDNMDATDFRFQQIGQS